MDAAPFRALRYDPSVAGPLAAATAPAYDDLRPLTYAQARTANPYTVLQLLAEAPPPAQGAARFRAAAGAYRRLRRTGVLRQDRAPGFYLYELHELRHGRPVRMRGLLAAVAAGDRATSGVAVHEAIDPERVERRVARLRAVPVDLAPVLVIASHLPTELGALLDRPPTAPPVAALSDEDGVDHRLWMRSDPEEVRAIRAGLADTAGMIADGHHRWAAARLMVQAPGADGHAPSRTLALVVDAARDGPQVLAVHRLLPRLPADWPERLRPHFHLTPMPPQVLGLQTALEAPGRPLSTAEQRATAAHDPVLGLLLPDGAALLRARQPSALRARLPQDASPAWRTLDAALVERVVLPLLGVDPAAAVACADPLRAAAELQATATTGAHLPGLLLLRPPDLATVMQVALGGEQLPAKSTSFRPKPRTGLLLRPIDLPAAPG